jgi:hypothetical protein
MMMTTLGAYVKHPKRPQVKAYESQRTAQMPKILVQKGFRRAPSMPEVLNNFLATRAQSGRRTTQSASVVIGNVLREGSATAAGRQLRHVRDEE